IVGLEFLDPNTLQVVCEANGKKRYWKVKANGVRTEIPASEIWEIPGFTLDGMNGISAIEYGVNVFGAAIAAEKAARDTFTNGLLQSVFYKINQWLNPTQRAEFKSNVQGSVERGEMPLLEGGVDVASIGIKPGDAQLLESRAFSVEA